MMRAKSTQHCLKHAEAARLPQRTFHLLNQVIGFLDVILSATAAEPAAASLKLMGKLIITS
jgi:hypothetical protein